MPQPRAPLGPAIGPAPRWQPPAPKEERRAGYSISVGQSPGCRHYAQSEEWQTRYEYPGALGTHCSQRIDPPERHGDTAGIAVGGTPERNAQEGIVSYLHAVQGNRLRSTPDLDLLPRLEAAILGGNRHLLRPWRTSDYKCVNEEKVDPTQASQGLSTVHSISFSKLPTASAESLV